MAETYQPKPTPLPAPRKPSSDVDYSQMSDEDLEKIASGKPQDPNFWHDIGVKYQAGVLFGTRPFFAGIGEGIGSAAYQAMPKEDQSLKEYGQQLSKVPGAALEGFKEGRRGAIEEEGKISREKPGMSLGMDLATGALTAPLFASGKAAKAGAGLLSGVGQAAKTGAIYGTGQAIGHAESIPEAAQTIGENMAAGAAFKAAGNALPMVGRGMGKGAAWLSANLTGIPQQDIETYFVNSPAVKKLMDLGGGTVSGAADEARQQTMAEINAARQSLNGEVSAVLNDPKYHGIMIDGSKVVNALEDTYYSASRARANYRPEDLAALKREIEITKTMLDKNGMMSIQDMNGVKQELQHMARGSYSKDKGVIIFPKYGENGGLVAEAAKVAAREARTAIDNVAGELKQYNGKLQSLHEIEDVINRNLIKPGGSEAALLAAGSGGNQRNASMLQQLDEVTGGKAQERAGLLSAGRSFSNAPMLPIDTSGKTWTRVGLASALAGFGNQMGLSLPESGGVGLLLASPAVHKYGLMPAAKLGSLPFKAATSAAEAVPTQYKSNILQSIINEQRNKKK